MAATISIVNYGMGNIRSVRNALQHLGVPERVITSADEVTLSAKIVLPGVGSFRAAMENIDRMGLRRALDDAVLARGVPVLGICLGMEIFADHGEEDGGATGLGWIPGTVRAFDAARTGVKLPHVGFNTARFTAAAPLFARLGEEADFYFVHSYHFVAERSEYVSAWGDYGEPFAAAVSWRNVHGTQFHPEKSQSNGLAVLKTFADLN